jgi:galactose mutarotase-like enzyme
MKYTNSVLCNLFFLHLCSLSIIYFFVYFKNISQKATGKLKYKKYICYPINGNLKTTISNQQLTAVINHHGGELVSLQANTGKEYIWEGNPDYWGKLSPILFPIVGTLKNGAYNYDGKKYQLTRHGFARDMEFDLIDKTGTAVVFSLKANNETRKLYPFDFELQIVYSIKESELCITYKVFNNSPEILFYGIGGHPAFSLPNAFEKYSLNFESNETLISYQLEGDLLSDKTIPIELSANLLPLTYSLFERDALIFKEMKSKQIQLLENNVPVLNFRFGDFPNFGIWTKQNAPFICLEPWAGYSDTISATGNIAEKEGIQTLEGNTVKEYSFSIEIL